MTPERERELFEACVKLDSEDRASFIDEACPDTQTAERIRRLVAAHERAQGDASALNPSAVAELEDPPSVGPYRILERLGEGGMGVVYLAEQSRPIRRRVALKVIKLGMDTKQVIARFESERQALALMNHSNIARILDAGATDQGRPYFVMEYVQGVPLHRYCDQQRLDIEARLRLFLLVCGAVEHAHQRGVIHRDLKPSNVLVTEEQGQPVPKVIDFGIAKATDQRLSDHTLFTEFGAIIGTPEYMSPEQAEMSPLGVDVRTDVYALGVVLYELLAGALPFDLRRERQSPSEIRRIIRDLEPLPLNQRVAELEFRADAVAQNRGSTPPSLRRRLRGPLEWVTAKALEKDRLRRYASAAELGSDVERYLAHQPVAAEPPSALRQARRFLRHAAPAWLSRTGWLVPAAGGALAILAAWTLISPREGGTPASGRDVPRIVVLPFENFGAASDEYFADGITDEVTARLAGVRGLVVIARQSAVQYRETSKSPQQIGQELDADYILEASISWERTDGASRVRVRPQLIRAADASHAWADVYEDDLTAIFEVQRRIAAKVAEAMGVVLAVDERRTLGGKPTENLEAYDYYLRAIAVLQAEGLREETLHTSARLYERAIDLDPNFAIAYARLSVVHSLIYWFHYDPADARRAMAQNAAQEALRLQPGLAYGHLALGRYYYHGLRDYGQAIDHLLMADRIEPNNTGVLRALAYVRRRQGDWPGAVSALERVVALDPRDDGALANLAETHLLTRNYTAAERYLNAVQSLIPQRAPTLKYLLVLLSGGPQSRLDSITSHFASRGDLTEFIVSAGLTSPALLGRAVDLTRFMGPREEQALEQMVATDWNTRTEGYYLAKAGLYARRGTAGRARAYYDSARVVLESKLHNRPLNEEFHLLLAFAHAGLERTGAARTALGRALELLPISRDAMAGAAIAAQAARLEVMLGSPDAAVDRLEYLLSIPSPVSLPLLRRDPAFEPLRDHPRFRALLARQGG